MKENIHSQIDLFEFGMICLAELVTKRHLIQKKECGNAIRTWLGGDQDGVA